MPTVLLVRHGRTAANVAGVLAGRTAGVGIDETGLAAARALGQRLRDITLSRVVSGPLRRCRETAQALVAGAEVVVDDRLTECDYGDWTGRPLAELRRQRLWKVVQDHPSAAVFPGGESLRAVQARAVDAVRQHDAEVAELAGAGAVWAAVSHADVIKTVVADALGMHLDHFQRLVVDPCSVTAVSFTERRPFVIRLNDVGAPLDFLAPSPRQRRRRASGEAVVGGGSGDGPR